MFQKQTIMSNHPHPERCYIRPENPYRKASCLSRLFFTWAYPLLQVGLQRPLQEYDLPHVDTKDTSTQGLTLFQQFLSTNSLSVPKNDESLPSSPYPAVQYAILRYYLYSLRYTQVKVCVYISAMVIQAVALGRLLNYFSSSSHETITRKSTVFEGCLWATVLILCAAFMILSTHSLYYDVWCMGMRLRIASIAAIFDKTLKLSSSSSSSTSATTANNDTSTNSPTTMGQIVNLASNDSERFILASVFGLYLLWGPIHAIIVFIVGSILLQSILPFVIGYIFLGLFAIVQYIMSQRFVQYRTHVASITDHRVHWISQLLLGIRVLKMHAWEKAMTYQIQSIRSKEIKGIHYAATLRAMNEAIFFASSITICLIIFMVHHSRGGKLTLGTMYSIFALMNALQFTMVKYFSIAVMSCSECWVSVRRIVHFLSFPEISVSSHPSFLKQHSSQSSNTNSGNTTRGDTIVISFRDATCYWNHDHHNSCSTSKRSQGTSISSSFDDMSMTLVDESMQQEEESVVDNKCILALSSINLDVCRGELCCIIGPVGCGKSALLKAIARELPLISGVLSTTYEILSYSAQDPWIMNGTARDNILLGQEFNKVWYDQVVASCGLDRDFLQFIHGDATIIGDRGVQISGGQRARISLARALYKDADLLLLDDPLSAVDIKTGRLIYDHAIKGIAINRGKTVVLATHQHQFIRDEKCVAMDQGKILFIGSYTSCMEKLQGIQGVSIPTSYSDETQNVDHGNDFNIDVNIQERSNKIRGNFSHSVVGGDGLYEGMLKNDDEATTIDENKEYREKGGVTLSTWRHYEQALGGRVVSIVIICMMLLTQASLILAVATTASWARRSQTQDAVSRLKLAIIFCAILILLSFIRSITFFRLAINASKHLHDDMTYAVLRATILFFDTNPIGRILNRFSSDVGTTDDSLPLTLFDFLATFTMVIGGIATAIVVLPPVLLSVPLLLVFFLRSRKVFVCSSREIKRLEGLSRSPIFDSIAESLSGVATIRANDALPYFRSKFENAQDAHSRAFFAFIYSSRYVGVRIDCLMFAVIFISCYLAIIFKETDLFHINSVTIGLALSMLLQMGDVAQWSTRQSAEVTNQMISVERLYQYSQLPSEAPLDTPADSLLGDTPSSWPSQGAIQVKNLCVRYRPSLPLSLLNINFDIKPRSHVAICGRTGGGKSTLVQSFLRLLEAEDGKILIDGADVSTLGLHRLRHSITVINQVPTLYGCVTVRDNLDPLGERSEEEIRQALMDVQMIQTIDQMNGGLDAMVSEGGGNFSVGQRALLGLARAILRKSKIVILDEPTANVDRETEFFIQEAIRKRFHDATMITVAHRLNTIIECDHVLVLGNGRLIEWGTPSQLLEVTGAFASLVDETGAEMALQLRAKARNKDRFCRHSAASSE